MVQMLALDSPPAESLTGWRAHQELIDALPYVDPLTTSEQRAVDQLVAEEMRRSPLKLRDYVAQLPLMPASRLEADPVLATEMQRYQAGQPMAKLDQERYNMRDPPQLKKNDIATWQNCIQNAHSQLEHQLNRLVNLELLLKFGPNAWRFFNDQLENYVTRLQTEAQQLKKEIEDVNRQRKVSQLEAGKQLDTLQAQWAAGITKNQEIDRACQELEVQIKAAREQQAAVISDEAALVLTHWGNKSQLVRQGHRLSRLDTGISAACSGPRITKWRATWPHTVALLRRLAIKFSSRFAKAQTGRQRCVTSGELASGRLSACSLHCSAKYEDTILTVKKKVEVKMGVPVDKQLLFWHNKELTALYDNKTLLDLHLHTGFSLKGYNLSAPPDFWPPVKQTEEGLLIDIDPPRST
ncbi:hypothetical protein WJX84_005084 [Apatococcus fuscideae]|uniref:Ubiquitin-like domain-containing protein n=1 Tax=Apatococcus fuscideae TaxID=2026836 RepID=A0AAW1TGR1_9CHLO